MKVLIFGWYGHGNFGDELILASLLHLEKGQEITVLSDNAEHTERIHSVRAVEWRREIKGSKYLPLCAVRWLSLLREFHKTDLLIVGGGGLWNDKFSSNILYYAGLPLIACFMGKVVVARGMGIDSHVHRHLSKIILRLAGHYYKVIEVRDSFSARELDALDVPYILGRDLAETYPYQRKRNLKTVWAISPSTKPLVFIPDENDIQLSCFDPEDLGLMQSEKIILKGDDYRNKLEVLEGAAFVYSSRLHPLIVARALGIPCKSLSDVPKIIALEMKA